MRGKKPLSGLLAVAAITGVATIGAAPAAAQSRSTITISGSTSVFPLATKLARRYVRERPGTVRFNILQGGSDVGVADAARGRVTIGNSSRDPQPGDPGGITFYRIARDALCVATNPANRISGLTTDQIRAIFQGRVRDWGQIPGATVTGTIDVNVRVPASGTQDAFGSLFLGSSRAPTAPTATQRQSNGLVQQAVRSNPNAIGYVSLAFTRGINPVQFNGVGCTLRAARAGQYSGARNFYMITRGPARGAARRFITWIRRDRDAQRVIATEWVPLR